MVHPHQRVVEDDRHQPVQRLPGAVPVRQLGQRHHGEAQPRHHVELLAQAGT